MVEKNLQFGNGFQPETWDFFPFILQKKYKKNKFIRFSIFFLILFKYSPSL